MTSPGEDIFRSLSQLTADGLIVSDAEGKVIDLNPALISLLGDERDTFIGKPLYAVADCSCLRTQGQYNGKPPLPSTTEGASLHNANLVTRAGMEHVMAVNHLSIEAANGSARYLTMVYIVQANAVQQAQTDFVSTVSHELRTPLTSIKGFADTILRAGDRLDASQQKRYIGIIKDQADRLTRLVEDLLAVSRLESRKLQLTIRAIDLEQVVQRVVRNLTDKAQQHQIATRIPPALPSVWADADRLEQILTNLIDNAIKYSPQGTTVTVNAKSLEKTADQQEALVEVSVTDEGGGIPKEQLPEIFNKFSRLDNPLVRQTEGTGLGLYITKSLVLALRGTIQVESQPGATTFSVRLPAASLEEQAARGRGVLC